MKSDRFKIVIFTFAAAVIFSACTGVGPRHSSAAPGDFVYRGHDFGPNRNSDYRSGVLDGCKTVDGDYTKDHARYNENLSYHNGWEHGRLHCKARPAQ